MKFAICDDESTELKKVVDFLLKFDPQADFQCFSSAQAMLNAYQTEYYDIVLLDIEMNDLNGFQAASALNQMPDPPLILFITQSGAYTIQGYEVAFRYLKKPLSYEEFERALSAAMDKRLPKRICIHHADGTTFLRVQDIRFIEIYNYLALIHTADTTYECRVPLKKLEQDLSGCGFARPHQSYLVNLEYVTQLQKNCIFLTDGSKIPLSRNRQKAFENAIFCFLRR